MAAITPNSDLILLKVPLEIDDTNQLTFATATAQYNYFNGLTGKKSYDKFTYQRKDGVIRVNDNMDDLLSYNYVMYRNTNYSNKWFYAYITGLEYINDGVTAVSIKTDCYQTWMFDLTYKPTFVEREHVNDDTPGLHTVPENLEVGEYEIVDLRDSPIYINEGTVRDWIVCFAVSAFPASAHNIQSNGKIKYDTGYLGGVFNGLNFFCVSDFSYAEQVIRAYNNDTGVTAGAIKNIYMIPRCFLIPYPSGATDYSYLSLDDGATLVPLYAIYNFYESEEYKLQQPSVLAGNYEPVNKKLLSYPFSYFYLTNKSGETITYRYEDFPIETINTNTARTITYKKAIVPSTSLSGKLYFTKYKNYTDTNAYGTKMYSYGINYGKAPVCAWTTDYYTNWLTQNGVNVGLSIASSIANLGVSTLGTGITGLPLASLSAGVRISNTLGEVHKASVTPPQAHGDINTGDFNYAFQRNSISFYEMSVRPEVAKIIDDYFSAYGYQVNQLKIPNVTGRTNWNYVKTVGCYIKADIPQEDLQTIKNMFDRGVTFWHNPATFGDYSQTNAIVG